MREFLQMDAPKSKAELITTLCIEVLFPLIMLIAFLYLLWMGVGQHQWAEAAFWMVILMAVGHKMNHRDEVSEINKRLDALIEGLDQLGPMLDDVHEKVEELHRKTHPQSERAGWN